MNGTIECTSLREKLALYRLRLEIHARNCGRCSENLGWCEIQQKFETAIHTAEMLIHGGE